MAINDRVKEVRKVLNMSQEAFGEKLGITKSAVSIIESGKTKVTDTMTRLICNEFDVDPFWLETGDGDMFVAMPETAIDELVEQYKLNNDDKIVIKTYSESPSDQRDVIKNFLLTLAENLQKKDG